MGGGKSRPDRPKVLKLETSRSLKVNDEIEVTGTIDCDAKTFSIALVSDYDDGIPKNVPYHYKVYFEDGKTITNVKHEGKWRTEKEVEHSTLKRGTYFSINIKITEQGFETCVNDTQKVKGPYGSDYDVNSLELWEECQKIKSISLRLAD